MLIMPIKNEGRILNVAISLVSARKIGTSSSFLESGPSNVIINKRFFSESSYYNKKNDASVVVDFIHNNNIAVNSSSFYVTTKFDSNNSSYDVYEVDVPNHKLGVGLNSLFGECVMDLCCEGPDIEKGRNISLSRLGISNHITDERLEKLEYLANNLGKINTLNYIKENDLQDLIDTIEFLDLFDCTVISKSSIKCDDMESMLQSLKNTSNNTYKELKKYYDMAQDNARIYSRLSKLYHIVYNRPYSWIHSSKEKIKMKKMDSVVNTLQDIRAA